MIDNERIAFLVGMPRAATTFLYHNFNLHPDIFIPYRRKTNYFSLHYHQGVKWFSSHFKDAPEGSIAVDTETLAFVNRRLNSPQLIKAFNRNAKIILCVRDPAAWAVSLYEQIGTFDDRILNFEDFLAGKYSLIEDGIATAFCMSNGDVQARVREYEELFPDSILILRFRDVIGSPLESLRKIERFLGISAYYQADNIITKKINSRKRKHNKLLNRLLRNEHLISFIRVIFPRKFVLAARWTFDRLSAGESADPGASGDVAEEGNLLHLAKTQYKSDIEALEKYI